MRADLMIKIAVVVVCSSYTLTANGARAATDGEKWTFVTSTPTNSMVFIEESTLKTLPPKVGREFKITQAWFLWEHSEDKTEKARRSKRLMRFDCVGEQIGTFGSSSYAPNGSVISSWNEMDDYDSNYAPTVPGSVGAALMKDACAYQLANDLERAADRLDREAKEAE